MAQRSTAKRQAIEESTKPEEAVPIPQKKRMFSSDEGDLIWYFCSALHKFERSVHGAMADRVERDSMSSSKCFVCHCSGVIEDQRAINIHKSNRRGGKTVTTEVAVCKDGIWTTEKRTQARTVQIGDQCDFCHGTGWLPSPRTKPRCDCWGLGPRTRSSCPECLGTGVPRFSAVPRHEIKEAAGAEVDGDTSARYALISRRISHLPVVIRVVLSIYYGPHGNSWEDQPQGRILSLMEFTKSGQYLLRKTKQEGDEATGASDAEKLASQWELERRDSNPGRKGALEAAEAQANTVLDIAQQAWLRTKLENQIEEEDEPAKSLAEQMEEILANVNDTASSYETWLDKNWSDGIKLEEL